MACAWIFRSLSLPAPAAGAQPIPPALPPTLGHVWVSLCEADEKKRRKSLYHTYSQLQSTSTNCWAAHCIIRIIVLIMSSVSANYKAAGDLCGTHWKASSMQTPPAWCSCKQQIRRATQMARCCSLTLHRLGHNSHRNLRMPKRLTKCHWKSNVPIFDI